MCPQGCALSRRDEMKYAPFGMLRAHCGRSGRRRLAQIAPSARSGFSSVSLIAEERATHYCKSEFQRF